MDLTKLSDDDLMALKSGDLTKMSDAGLMSLQAQSPQVKPDQQEHPGVIAGRQVMKDFTESVKGGLASAPINLYLGAKQFAGGLTPVEQDVLKQNKEAANAAPVSAFVSNLATLAPTFFIPGSTTLAGAGAIGTGTGALTPIEGEQSFKNIGRGKAIGAILSGAGGMLGQSIGNEIGSTLAQNATSKASELASQASKNSVRDATLSEGLDAGFSIPRSLYNPSFFSNRLESLGGKAAVKQQAASNNQEAINNLAKKSLGIPEDQPLTKSFLDNLKRQAAAPYEEVANLPKTNTGAMLNKWSDPRADLEALKQARNDAQGWFDAYNRSKSPLDLANAKAASAQAASLEAALEGYAKESGKPDLVNSLIEARKKIAQIYDVRRSLNDATGDVSPNVFGSLYEKGKPLSDGLETIGKMRVAFPQVVKEGASVQAPGVSKSEALAGVAMGTAGAALTGNPTGAAAAALPLISVPARSLALSKLMQSQPIYTTGALTKLGSQITPNKLSAILRAYSMQNADSLSNEGK